MAETTDRWVAARGRRIYCRVHRPRSDQPLPTLVYFHGGGWVWGSVDTQDSAARSLAAAGQVATVSVDYALSPEAKFP
jgi:acetyl esterase